MKGTLKYLRLFLILAVVLAFLVTGCSNQVASPTPTKPAPTNAEPTKPDTSKEVDLVGYMLGSAPDGMAAVVTELNKRLKTDINATVQFNYIGWSDFSAKYPLVLASGEDFDFIYTANWSFYPEEAAKGAFKELDETMIEQFMPKYYAAQDKTAYAQCRIDGKLYMIPTGYADPFLHVGIIRADLRKKYGVPEIKKLADLGPYLDAIKKNEPSMIPMNIESSSDSPDIFNGLLVEQGSYLSLLPNTYLYYDAFGTDGKMYTFQDEPIASRVKNAVTILKSWYDSGYINKNVYANKTLSRDSFIAGTSGFADDNSVNCQKLLDAAKTNGWEVEFINMTDSNGKAPRLSFMMNGVALPKNAKNTERTLMFLDRIISDKDYSMLIYYGIEGTNYIIKDGKISLPDGLAADKNTYAPDAAGFWFTDKRLYPPSASWSDAYLAERALAAESNVFSPMAAFGLVTDDIKTEMANISTVSTQYFLPLTYGLVNGTVDDALATLNEKLNLAGIDKVKTEVESQAKAYLASIK